MIETKYVIVGSGFFGSVLAERIASVLQADVTIIEKRSHIGGNSYSCIDPETGIEYHKYGSHIFHTFSKKVWDYIRQFGEFTPYRHKVMTTSQGQIYSMPINLKTICDVYQKGLTPAMAEQLIDEDRRLISNPEESLETKAIFLIGKNLYEKFIKGYTIKQWNKHPTELPADIITRLPVRFNFNSDYFNDPYQGVPLNGYGALFQSLLSNPKIHVMLNTNFAQIKEQIPADATVIYTGMIDEYFDYCYGSLEWRSLRFDWETHNVADYQGTTVMNYADAEISFTRIHEFKHYHPERQEIFSSAKTIICKEYPHEWSFGEEAYYPVNTPRNQDLFQKYQELAEKTPNLIFGGRLGCYKYWDMDKAILNALECFENKIERLK